MKNYIIYSRLLKKPFNLISNPIKKGILILQENLEESDRKDIVELNTNDKKISMPSPILINLLEDKTKYKVIEKFLKNKNSKSISLFSIDKDGSCKMLGNFSKTMVVIAILKGITSESKKGNISNEISQKYQKLTELISYDKFIEEKGNEETSYKSYRGNYTIKKSEIMKILSLPEKEIKELLANDTIMGIPAPEFLECATQAIELKDFIIPSKIVKNKNFLDSEIDNTIIYFDNEQQPRFHENIEVNEMLWEEIWNKTPTEFNPLEKAYYIYNELCKIFTFDEEAYVNNDTEKTSIVHDISRLKTINKENAEILCYEFASIYSKFLEALNLPYKIVGGETYGPNHIFVEFAYKDFHALADSTRAIINSDLSLAKRGKILEGFTLVPWHSSQAKEKFQGELNNVRIYIENENKNETSQSMITIYQQHYQTNYNELTLEERKRLYLQLIDEITLKPLDAMGYILDMEKAIFTEDYKNFCDTYFLKDNKPSTIYKQRPALAAIICFREKEYDYDNKQYEYYLYKPTVGVERIEKQHLQDKFLSKELQYINNRYFRNNIPSICIGGDDDTKTSGLSR